MAKLGEYGFICGECAIGFGGTWPKGHVATCHDAVCCYCGERKSLANIGDWDWPDKTPRGMRD